MTAADSTRKPAKPKGSPLFAHNNGQWARKINGRIVCFGVWNDHDGALRRHHEQYADLKAGRRPRPSMADSPTLYYLVNAYLTEKHSLIGAGELAPRTFREYKQTCQRVVDQFGRERLVSDLGPDDFVVFRAKLAKTRNANTLKNEMQQVRSVFKFAWDNSLVSIPVRYGTGFKSPKKSTRRKERNRKPKRVFQADELRQMIDAADRQLKAMLLLGIQSGMGNHDVATLPIDSIDFDKGWVNDYREKTGVERRFPLWQETVNALREVIDNRKQPRDEADGDLVFITKYRNRWVRDTGETWVDSISRECGKLIRKLKLPSGRNFYALRHTFQTVGDQTGLYVVVKSIMAHAESDGDMSANYRENVSDENMQSVVDHVHAWLYGGSHE
jgi:integrase